VRKHEKRLDAGGIAVAGATAEPLTPNAHGLGSTAFAILAHDWKRVALITIIVTAIAWALAAVQPRRYRASALASVVPLASALEPNELLRGMEVLERRQVIATLAALASTPTTRSRVAAGTSVIDAVVLPNTNLVRIDVEGGNSAQVTNVANRVPAILDEESRAMYRYYVVTLVSPATRPLAPFFPRVGRAIVAGAAIGLFLGLFAVYAQRWRAALRGSAP
jgi:uncharacterized protein involved in exopolysaccharide biosynthesis